MTQSNTTPLFAVELQTAGTFETLQIFGRLTHEQAAAKVQNMAAANFAKRVGLHRNDLTNEYDAYFFVQSARQDGNVNLLIDGYNIKVRRMK